MMNESQIILDKIYEYFSEIGYEKQIVYGSFIERMKGFDVIPNDIDLTIITDDLPDPRHKTFYLGFTDLPINVEFLSENSFKAELNSMQPKYFMCISNPSIIKNIDFAFKDKELHEVRSCISSISSKAFDKGKKKLLVEDDYDEVLGLKNIFHAFKFVKYANWYYYPEFLTIEDDTKFLNEVHEKINELYKNSTGTLEERVQTVLEYAKPLYNSEMTEFRTLFPKLVK